MKYLTLLICTSYCAAISLTAWAPCYEEPCFIEQTDTSVGALDGYHEWDEQCPCYYYYYEADMDENWFEQDPSWPSRREDSWYDRLTR